MKCNNSYIFQFLTIINDKILTICNNCIIPGAQHLWILSENSNIKFDNLINKLYEI
jgi:hypothetical protein